MRPIRTWLPFVALALTALVALLLAGSRSIEQRSFALGSPNQTPVAVLHPSGRICEGPVNSQGPVRGVRIWGASVGGPGEISVEVEDASSRQPLTTGTINATTSPRAYQARLARTVPEGRPLFICLVGKGTRFSLLGSLAVRPNVTISGTRTPLEFSLVLLDDGKSSLLGSLGEVFSRASLFRPGWVGAWTFWALAAGLLAFIPLGALAIAYSSRADYRSSPPDVDVRD